MNRYLQLLRNKGRDDQESSEVVLHPAGLFSNPWLIAAVFLVVTALGICYALTTVPVYEASAVIQLKHSPSLTNDGQADTAAATEIEILRSRSILSGVVQKLHLDINAEPKSLPVIGAVLDRNRRAMFNTESADTEAGDAEQLHISLFNVPQALVKRPFILTARSGGGFSLTQNDAALKIDGRAGEIAYGHSRYGDVEILVTELHAKAGSQFFVRRMPTFQVEEQLQRSLVVAENGKQSNVIRIALQGSNPESISRILNEIGNEYVHRRLSEKSSEAAKLMQSYDRQLAESGQRLRKLDNRYAQVLQRYGTSDLAEASKSLSDQTVALQTKLSEMEQRKLELSSRYLDNHPAMEAVNRQIQDLRRDLDRVVGKRSGLAAAERELSSVTREKQTSSEINMSLLNGRQRLDALISSSEQGDVRLVDHAETPVQATTLGLRTMVALSCFAGLVLGLIASILKNAFVERHRARLMTKREGRFRLISMSRMEPPRGI